MESNCSCPFCSPRSLSLNTWSLKCLDLNLSWRVCFVLLLLLLSGCEARRLKESESAQTLKSDSDIATIHYAQKFDAKSSEGTDCVSMGSCNCKPVGKCKPCSRLDISRQFPSCMITGFKQRSFCSDSKKERFTSCHYSVDPREARTFWLFEGSAFSLGMLAYAMVVYRIRKMDRLTALRILEQINA